PIKFIIDTKPPAVTSNTIPAQTNKPPELSGSLGSEAGDLPSVVVKIYRVGIGSPELVAEQMIAIASKATTWSYTSPNLPDGTYLAQATQADEAENRGESAPVTFTIDTVPPVATLNPPPARSNNRRP